MAVGEQPATVEVLQVLLQAAQQPRAVVAEAQYLAPDPPRFVAEAMRFGEQVAVEQADEVREAVVVAVVGRRGQQQQVIAALGEPLGELVTPDPSTSSPRPAERFVYALHLCASSMMTRSQCCRQTRSRTSSCLA